MCSRCLVVPQRMRSRTWIVFAVILVTAWSVSAHRSLPALRVRHHKHLKPKSFLPSVSKPFRAHESVNGLDYISKMHSTLSASGTPSHNKSDSQISSEWVTNGDARSNQRTKSGHLHTGKHTKPQNSPKSGEHSRIGKHTWTNGPAKSSLSRAPSSKESLPSSSLQETQVRSKPSTTHYLIPTDYLTSRTTESTTSSPSTPLTVRHSTHTLPFSKNEHGTTIGISRDSTLTSEPSGYTTLSRVSSSHYIRSDKSSGTPHSASSRHNAPSDTSSGTSRSASSNHNTRSDKSSGTSRSASSNHNTRSNKSFGTSRSASSNHNTRSNKSFGTSRSASSSHITSSGFSSTNTSFPSVSNSTSLHKPLSHGSNTRSLTFMTRDSSKTTRSSLSTPISFHPSLMSGVATTSSNHTSTMTQTSDLHRMSRKLPVLSKHQHPAPMYAFVNTNSLVLPDSNTTTSSATEADKTTTATPTSTTDSTVTVDSTFTGTSTMSSATPSALPLIIKPSNAPSSKPADATLIAILFKPTLPWAWIVEQRSTTAQIFTYMPEIIANAVSIKTLDVVTVKLRRYDPQDGDTLYKYRTLYLAYMPKKLSVQLQELIKTNSSLIFNPGGGAVPSQLANEIDPTFDLLEFAQDDEIEEDHVKANDTRNALVGSFVGVGGAVTLGVLIWLLQRHLKKRKHRESKRVSRNDSILSFGNDSPDPYLDGIAPHASQRHRAGSFFAGDEDGSSAHVFEHPQGITGTIDVGHTQNPFYQCRSRSQELRSQGAEFHAETGASVAQPKHAYVLGRHAALENSVYAIDMGTIRSGGAH